MQNPQKPFASNRKRTVLLASVFVALLPVAYYSLLQDPLVNARFAALLHRNTIPTKPAVDLDKAEIADPAPGMELPDAGTGHTIRSGVGPSPKGYLLVGLGDCASCIAFEFRKWQDAAGTQNIPLLAFSNGSPQHITDFRKMAQANVPVFHDADFQLTKQINCYWGGRVYYFDSHWKLRWLMHGMGNSEPFERQYGLLDAINGGQK